MLGSWCCEANYVISAQQLEVFWELSRRLTLLCTLYNSRSSYPSFMSKLLRDVASFKATLQRQDTTSWHSSNTGDGPSTPAPTTEKRPPAEEPANSPSGPKKKRPKPNIVYSQPADTSSGQKLMTQLYYAVDFMKRQQGPMRLEDIANQSETPLDAEPELADRFKNHEKIQYDVKTNLYSYKHEYNFRNKASLLTEIQRQTRKGNGISVKVLKESWKEAASAIEELEKEGEVLVTRTVKDSQLRMVFWNEVKPTEEQGGMAVDKEFIDLWHTLKVPNDVDLLKQLASDGLQATVTEAAPVKTPAFKKKGKKGGAPRQRQIRLTNVHLKGEIDLTKDFVPPGK